MRSKLTVAGLLIVGCVAAGVLVTRLWQAGAGEGSWNHAVAAPHRTPANSNHPEPLAGLDDLPARIAATLQHPSVFRARALHQLAGSLAPAEIVRALELAADIPDAALQARFRRSLLSRWAESHPELAVEYAEALADPWARHAALLVVLDTWLTVDFENASAWVRALPDGPLGSQAFQKLAHRLAAQNPDARIFLVEPPAGVEQHNLVLAMLGQQAVESPEAAAALALELRFGDQREQALQMIATQCKVGLF